LNPSKDGDSPTALGSLGQGLTTLAGKIKSNHQPNTTVPAKPCPEVKYLHVFLNTLEETKGLSLEIPFKAAQPEDG